jgi:hypothetical protein
MLESIVELLGGLLLIALPLLIGSCIVGSILAALRAVQSCELRRERLKKRKAVLIAGAALCTSLVLKVVSLARS